MATATTSSASTSGRAPSRLCQLKDVRGKRTLVKFGYHPLPPQTIVDGHVIMNTAAIVEGLNALFNQHKIKRREVALAVSGHAVIIKRMALPMMTNAELDEQIDWEAEQQIPYDIKDVQIDYEVLRKRPSRGRWTCSSWRRRRTRSTTRRRSRARRSSSRW
jgi:type IV pilus assembly protein PilM